MNTTSKNRDQHLDAGKIRASIMSKISGDADMLAMGSSIGRVVEMASSEDKGTHELAYYVLSDVGLSQRILRLANTVTYRTASGSTVTTISRAISILGLDRVKTAALAMLLVDALSNSKHAGSVIEEIQIALCASLIGREVTKVGPYGGAEDASLGALFKNLGALLVATHEYDSYVEIQDLIKDGKQSPEQASQSVLGCSFDKLSSSILDEWKIPDTIIRAIAPVPAGAKKVPHSRQEWMRLVASYSLSAAKVMARTGNPNSPEALALKAEFSSSLNLSNVRLVELYDSVQTEMTALLESMNISPIQLDESGSDLDDDTDILLFASMRADEDLDPPVLESGKPVNARDLLLKAVQAVTEERCSPSSTMNGVIQMFLDGLHSSMRFRFTTICLRNEQSGEYKSRISCGTEAKRIQGGFALPIAPSKNIFHLAMQNNADLMIEDSRSEKIEALMPEWHKKLLPETQSFIVLPLVIKGKSIGFVYADRIHRAPEGVPADETSLIKAMKNQLLMSLENAK